MEQMREAKHSKSLASLSVDSDAVYSYLWLQKESSHRACGSEQSISMMHEQLSVVQQNHAGLHASQMEGDSLRKHFYCTVYVVIFSEQLSVVQQNHAGLHASQMEGDSLRKHFYCTVYVVIFSAQVPPSSPVSFR